jgi:hypothetical protein
MLPKPSIFFLALSCFFYQTHAQHDPTVFDKFVKKPNIVWAAYANDTLDLNGYNLSSELVNGFKNKKIKISFPLNRDSVMRDKKIFYIAGSIMQQKMWSPVIYLTLHYFLEAKAMLMEIN